MSHAPRRIGLICFDSVTALDLTGPAEVFSTANQYCEGAYELLVLGSLTKPMRTDTGIAVLPDAALDDAPALDTIIIPGGAALRDPLVAGPIVRWLQRRRRTRRIASVCTGLYALAATGLLDGRKATTHWRFASDASRRFPKVSISPDAIFIQDDHLFTSAGVTAGIDLALALVEGDLGRSTALSVARELVVYIKRCGGQLQYSEPLRFEMRATDRFGNIANFIVNNLRKDLSVGALADRAGVGVRHFSRRFRKAFGVPPATYVELLRLDESRKRLATAGRTVNSVAASVGYRSADAFRRAFERRFGIAPSLYVERLSPRS
jgi:transcriptional regulator GlxA family with amidase domain